ncbi:hypothetical protein ACLKA7_002811 [Drosophila subpalustris]
MPRLLVWHRQQQLGNIGNSCNETDFTTLQEKLYSHQQNKQQKDPGSGPGVPALPEMTTSPSSPSTGHHFINRFNNKEKCNSKD